MESNFKTSYFAYKNDDIDLVELGQFLREVTDYRVEREHYVIFDKNTGKYIGHRKSVMKNSRYKYRNPDLILLDKKTGKIVFIIEIDGSVHDVYVKDTDDRNDQYEKAKLPLLVISKLDIDTNIFDYVYKKVTEFIKNK